MNRAGLTWSRVRKALMAVLAVAPVLGVTGWQVRARTYDIQYGSISGASPVGDSPKGVMHRAGSVDEIRFPLAANATYVLALSVRNPGSLPIRVTELPAESSVYDIEKIVMVDSKTAEETRCYCDKFGTAFRPTDVDPGKELLLFVTLRPNDSEWGPCTSAWIGSVPIRYTVLGIGQERRLHLPTVVGFQHAESDCAGSVTIGQP